MNQKLTVAQQEKQILDQQVRQKMDQLQETLREAKRANGLDPDEDLVQDWELETTTVDYLPHEWKQPEESPEAPYLNPPWETWVEDYVEPQTQTILDMVTEPMEVRAWWIPYMEFHRTVAAKLIVMDWLKDPQRVTIDAEEIVKLEPVEQFQQFLKLDHVVQEVREHLGITETRTLMGSLEQFAQRTTWGAFLQALGEHRKVQS